MEVLKSKLKEEPIQDINVENVDGEPKPEGEEPTQNDEEAELLRELAELREFVNNNKECIEDFFNIKRSRFDFDGDSDDDKDSLYESNLSVDKETPEQAEIRNLLNNQQKGE